MLEKKVIVVSGVGPGLGKEVARICLREGANVALGARQEKRLEAIAKELDPSSEHVAYCATDITKEEDCDALLQAAAQRFGNVHGLVQVAALDALFGTLESTSRNDWEKSLHTNVIGTLQMARSAAPLIAESGGGSIVLTGSQSMFLPPPNPQIAYASAKGALLSAMYHMAEELGPKHIRVNMVIPTWMWGPPVQAYVQWQAKQRQVNEEEIIGEITQGMAIPEIPSDDDVAEVIAFFCSDRSRAITGQSLMVNAGEHYR